MRIGLVGMMLVALAALMVALACGCSTSQRQQLVDIVPVVTNAVHDLKPTPAPAPVVADPFAAAKAEEVANGFVDPLGRLPSVLARCVSFDHGQVTMTSAPRGWPGDGSCDGKDVWLILRDGRWQGNNDGWDWHPVDDHSRPFVFNDGYAVAGQLEPQPGDLCAFFIETIDHARRSTVYFVRW